jgi:hypothetical protein
MSTFTSEPGTRLGGRYRLEDRLAAASGWSAWRAIDEILARPVSVITFASGFPRLQQVVTAARAASRLTDTRLTQVFDVEDSWEHAYIVLEWPVGETLADLLASGSLEPSVGARIVAETAAAISGAHAAGLAHLCLQPEAVRWTAGRGIKVTGLGIDAALAGISAEDPDLADTRGLGNLLYAVLTGMWPGADYPELPAAPLSDGLPRRPRQVRAGVPASLDEIASRALALGGGRESEPYTSPHELAAALAAVIPPASIPPAAAQARRDPRPNPQREQRRDDDRPARRRDYATTTAGAGPPASSRHGAGRVAAVAIVALVAAVALSAAAVHFLHSPAKGHGSGSPTTAPKSTGPQVTTLTPASASGFDALHGPALDPGDENSSMAPNLLDPTSTQGWATEQYKSSPFFGGLKAGSGLILDMGKPVRITSVAITFGAQPGADVELKVGNSDARTAANEQSMTTVAQAPNLAGGLHTFTITTPVTAQYLVVWFTKLPPMAGAPGRYQAQIFKIAVSGSN